MAAREPLVAVAAALALADVSIVTLALPELLVELDMTIEQVAAVIAVYMLVLGIALIPAEALRRRIGSRALGTAGLGLFAAASIACALADSAGVLIAFRGVQALGGAAALITAFDLLGAGTSERGRRAWVLIALLGTAVGPALGGALTQLFDWRAIFVAQAPLAAAGAVGCLSAAIPARHPEPRERSPRDVGALAALTLVSAALIAVLFLLVLLLVAGWSVEPLAAAAAVSVLPVSALAGARIGGPPRTRAAAGGVLLSAGVLSLAFLPYASVWWTLGPQLLAGIGIGLALPALAGELLPERSPREAAHLLSVRHLAIGVALLALAPLVAERLDASIERARERGVTAVLDSPLPPLEKIRLAPGLLVGVETDDPRGELQRAADERIAEAEGERREQLIDVRERVDDTVVLAVADAFRWPLVLAGILGLLAAAALRPPSSARPVIGACAVALLLPVAYFVTERAFGHEAVEIPDPCRAEGGDVPGGLDLILEQNALALLNEAACEFGSSRAELVLALADEEETREYEAEHGVNPREASNLLDFLFGG